MVLKGSSLERQLNEVCGYSLNSDVTPFVPVQEMVDYWNNFYVNEVGEYSFIKAEEFSDAVAPLLDPLTTAEETRFINKFIRPAFGHKKVVQLPYAKPNSTMLTAARL